MDRNRAIADSACYRFDSLISSNQLCESWVATQADEQQRCFVKLAAHDSDLGTDVQEAVLSKSFHLQKVLRSNMVLSAVRKRVERGRLYIEYPYCDPDVWPVLTQEAFWKHFPSIFSQICLCIDYVHDLGLVHGDMKLSNFLINCEEDKPSIRLIDLDFLREAYSTPDARVFGTPEHVAPEILTDERVLTQSDNYSLGVSVRRYLESYRREPEQSGTGPVVPERALEQLADRLTATDPLRRPRVLILALLQGEIIDQPEYESLERRLLAMALLSRFRTQGRRAMEDPKKLRKFFYEESRCLGLPEDLLDLLSGALTADVLGALRIVRDCIEVSEIRRHADYWHLTLTDEKLEWAFRSLEQIQGIESRWLLSSRSPRPGDLKELAQEAAQCRQEGKCHQAYLKYRSILTGIEASAHPKTAAMRETVLRELGELCQSLNRLHDAVRYWTDLLDLKRDREELDSSLLRDIARLLLQVGDETGAAQLIEKGLQWADRDGDVESALKLLCIKAWNLGIRKDYDAADQLLRTVLSRAAAQEMPEVTCRAYYVYGYLNIARGAYDQAEEYLHTGLEIAEQNALHVTLIKVTTSLSSTCFELAAYHESIKLGKMAIKAATERNDALMIALIGLNIVCAHTRLAEFDKARYWLQRSLSLHTLQNAGDRLFLYYLNDGFFKSNSGDQHGAKESWYRALELPIAHVEARNLGKVYHNLAEAALYQGESQDCAEYLAKARHVLTGSNDTASLYEIELIDLLNQRYNGEGVEPDRFVEQLDRLVAVKGNYYACLCLFHILLYADRATAERALKVAAPLMPLLGQSKTALFSAVSTLIQRHQERFAEDEGQVKILKEVFRVLRGASMHFLALLVADRIAAMYAANAQYKLSKKFLQQSRRLAESLECRPRLKAVDRRLAGIVGRADDHATLIDSIHGVSRILTDIDDYDAALSRIVRFAVDQTGAERGVLLLKSAQSEQLRVAAYVDCDEDSLADIQSFSSTIPRTTADGLEMLVIENATTDKRTKDYKSIVVHNIHSVACVPIMRGEHLKGALYLDHHSIPALFDKEDITYIKAIANFIAVMLGTIQSYKSINLINRQLVQDLNRQGKERMFITEDRAMLELLYKLPDIARTNAPVLITGESGTGKEILCHMIHDLSLRSSKPLLKMNCAAITGSMIESELFGVARNAATGVAERPGKFEAADGGTLYLDEIADMPLEVQAKVLRVLEYHQFERVGTHRTVYTDVRYIYATNKDVMKHIEEGEFREDLYYRISTITIEIPPLRERRDDIPLLANHFMQLFSVDTSTPQLTPEATTALIAYPWPGNVRELKNLMERLCILHRGKRLSLSHLPPEIQKRTIGQKADSPAARSIEKARIREVLHECQGNQSKAARRLEMPLTTLRRKIKQYNLVKG